MTPTLLLLFAACPQETPLLQGAYRGPYDEVFLEQGGEEASSLDGWERWEFWFEQHRARLLRGPIEAEPEALLADGRYGRHPGALTREQIEREGLPLLHDALRSPFAEVREAAALALGRIGHPSSSTALREASADPIAQVRQAAFLGLGLLGDEDSLVRLGEVLSDRTDSVGDRAFAALGLGLSRRPEAAQLLRQHLTRNMQPDRLFGEQERLLLAAIHAAGMSGDARLLPALLEGARAIERGGSSASRRALAETLWAVGALGDPAGRPFLSRHLRDHDLSAQRAAALALGSLGDEGAVASLAERFSTGGDPQTLVNCLLSAGRLGGPAAWRFLTEAEGAARRHRQLHAAWGLAVGLARAAQAIESVHEDFITAKKGNLESARDEKRRRDEERLRGALALGLSFFGDPRVLPDLVAVSGRSGVDPDFAGYLALAIGWLGGDAAHGALVHLAEEGPVQSDCLRGLVEAFALLRTEDGAARTLDFLLEERDDSVRLAAARSLGYRRSATTCTRLVEALEGPGEVSRVPARYAHLILALGYLGDPYRADRMSRLLDGLDHRLETPLLRALQRY